MANDEVKAPDQPTVESGPTETAAIPGAPSSPVPLPGSSAPPPSSPAPEPSTPPPGSFFKTLGHSFMGGILGALAGGQDKKTYAVDSDPQSPHYGKMVEGTARKTTGEKISDIIRASMAGLAAGSTPQVQGQKSGLAKGLAGIGAGAQAVEGQDLAADKQKRERAKEDFASMQAADVHRANIAHSNALTYSLWQHSAQEGISHDPERQMYKSIVDSAQAAGISVKYVSDAELQRMAESDPTFLKTHLAMPLGSTPLMENGKPVTNPDGTPKMVGKIALMDAQGGQNIQLPGPLVQDIRKYGKGAGFSDDDIKKLSEDLSVPAQQFVSLFAKIQDTKKQALAAKPEMVMVDGKLKARNPISQELKEPTEQQRLDHEKEMQEISFKKAETQKAQEDIAIKAKELEQLKNMGIVVPPGYKTPENVFRMSSQEVQNNLLAQGVKVPANLDALWRIGHYKAELKDFPAMLRKGVGQIDRQTALNLIGQFINPNYSVTKFEAVKQLEKEFASTRSTVAGGNLIAFGTATDHLGQLWDIGEALQTGNMPALNAVRNWYRTQTGKELPNDFNGIKTALAGELGKTFKGAAPDIPEREAIDKTINDAQSPEQLSGIAKQYAHLMLSKASELISKYAAYTGELPPGALSEQARSVYRKMGINPEEMLTRGAVVPVGATGAGGPGTPQPEPTPKAPPAGATMKVPDKNGKLHWSDGKNDLGLVE